MMYGPFDLVYGKPYIKVQSEAYPSEVMPLGDLPGGRRDTFTVRVIAGRTLAFLREFRYEGSRFLAAGGGRAVDSTASRLPWDDTAASSPGATGGDRP